MWATIAEGDPKPLGAAQSDINAKLSGGTKHTEGQQVSGTASQGLETEKEGKMTSGTKLYLQDILNVV